MRKLIPALFVVGIAMLACVTTVSAADDDSRMRGTIQSVNEEKNTFSIRDTDDKTIEFQMAESGKVTLNEERNRKLSDLKKGDSALVVYQRKGENNIASEIRASRPNEQVQGTIQSINSERQTITVKDKDDKTLTLQMPEGGAQVGLNNKSNLKLSDLKEGDQVTVLYFKKGESNICSQIKAKRTSD